MSNFMNNDIVKAMVKDQTELAKELTNLTIENQKLVQKQVNTAMDAGRASMEMARDFGLKSAEMWQKAVMTDKAEA